MHSIVFHPQQRSVGQVTGGWKLSDLTLNWDLLVRANIAAAAGGIIFFMLYLPYSFMVVWEETIHSDIKILSVSFQFYNSFLLNLFSVFDIQHRLRVRLLLLLPLRGGRGRRSVGQHLGETGQAREE